jgi:hypothetical protein
MGKPLHAASRKGQDDRPLFRWDAGSCSGGGKGKENGNGKDKAQEKDECSLHGQPSWIRSVDETGKILAILPHASCKS